MALIELVDKLIPVAAVIVGSIITFVAQHLLAKSSREDRFREILLVKGEEIAEITGRALQDATAVPAAISVSMANGEKINPEDLEWILAEGIALKLAAKTKLFFPKLSNYPLEAAGSLSQARQKIINYNKALLDEDPKARAIEADFDKAIKDYIRHLVGLVAGISEETQRILPSIAD